MDSLGHLKVKMSKKKQTIKDIIAKKIEDNQKELEKWKELLFLVVDESIDEKIEKLDSQVTLVIGTNNKKRVFGTELLKPKLKRLWRLTERHSEITMTLTVTMMTQN